MFACQVCSKVNQQITKNNDIMKMSEKFFDLSKMLQNEAYFLKKNSLCIFSCIKM